MPIRRVRSALTGLVEGGGVSTMYFTDVEATTPQETVDLVYDFWTAMAPEISSAVTIDIEPVVDTLDEATGDLLTSASTTSAPRIGSASGTILPPATQGLLRLETNTIVGGKRLRGKLFIPGVTNAQGSTVPTSTYRTNVQNAALGLIADTAGPGPWVVWSRTNGTFRAVESADVWDKWAVLRSRRD